MSSFWFSVFLGFQSGVLLSLSESIHKLSFKQRMLAQSAWWLVALEFVSLVFDAAGGWGVLVMGIVGCVVSVPASWAMHKMQQGKSAGQ